MTKRRGWAVLGVVVVVAGLLAYLFKLPPDTTPEGAYLRIARAVRDDDLAMAFHYLEEDAQHACFTVADYASRSKRTILEAYPEAERAAALTKYDRFARDGEGPAIFVLLATERSWIGRLRRDLSGVGKVEIDGERATVITARGTRYPFRKRPNGLWGLTIFTAELTQEAEHLARDWDLVQAAADDYRRAKTTPKE